MRWRGEARLVRSEHNDYAPVARRLDKAYTSLGGIHDNSCDFILVIAVRRRYHDAGTDSERISHGTSERWKVPFFPRRAVTGLTRAAGASLPN